MTERPSDQPYFDVFSDASMRDILYVLFRHKFKILLCFLMIAGGMGFYAYWRPDKYASQAQILIKSGPVVDMLAERKDDVDSELAILKSPALLEDVVKQLGAQRFVVGRQSTRRVLEQLGLIDRLSEEAQAVLLIEKNLRLAEAGGQVIELDLRTEAPEFSREALQALLDLYITRHVEAHKSSTPLSFIEDKAAEAKARLEKSEETLREFQNKYKITSGEKQRLTFIQQISDIENNLSATDSRIEASKSRIVELDKMLKTQPERVESLRTSHENTKVYEWRNQLAQLKLTEIKLRQNYKPEARAVREVGEQIAVIEKLLESEPERVQGVTTELNALRESFQKNLDLERVSLAAEEAGRKVLAAELEKRQEQIANLNANEMTVNQLQRAVEINDKEYREYTASLQTSRIAEMLEKDKVGNVSVVQPPTLAIAPVGLRRPLVALVGILLGLFVGVALAFVMEFIDSSLKTNADVEKRLGLAVLASLTRSEMRTMG